MPNLKELYTIPNRTNQTEMNDEFAEHVKNRFDTMCEYRENWRRRAEEARKLEDVFQEWLVDGEDYGRPVRFPTVRDTRKALVDEIMRNQPKASIMATRGENKSKAQALQFVLDSKLNNPYEKRVKAQCLNDMFETGMGFRKCNYMKVMKKREIDGEDKEIVRWDGVKTERIDPRDVYLDEKGLYLYDPSGRNCKRDVIIKYYYAWSTFLDFFSDNEDVNQEALSRVGPIETDEGEMFKSDREVEEKVNTLGVKVYEYYNQEADVYGIVANGITIIGPKPIKHNHGRIPLVMYRFETRSDSTLGVSLAELIAPYVYAQDTIFNLEFKGLKLRLQPVLALDSSLGFNQRINRAEPGGVWEFAVEPGQSIANKIMPLPLAQGDSNGFYAMDRHLESKMTITTNHDRNALFLSPGELATQTQMKQQSMEKRTNTIVFENEIEAEAQLIELMIADIKQYETSDIDVEIKGKKTKRPRRINVKGYYVVQGDSGAPKFTPAVGEEAFFNLTKETVDTDVEIEIIDMRSKAMLQEQKIGRLLQFIPIATNLVNSYAQVNPKLLEKLDVVGILEQTAEAIDMDIGRTIIDNETQEYDIIRNEHYAFIAGMTVPLSQGETPEMSKEHYENHLEFRYKKKDGKLDFKSDSNTWKSLDDKSKKAFMEHLKLTQQNIVSSVLKTQEQATGASMPPVQQQMPNQKFQQPKANPDGTKNQLKS